MEALMTWAKENYDLISLFVGVVGVIIAVISLFYEIQRKKQRKTVLRLEIEKKEAQLKAMEMSYQTGFNAQEFGNINMQLSSLRAEIEQLKKQL